ncbi:MAG: PEP-CTERM sorting domain-containing protein [Pseudomonadota bacterium]
MAALLAFCVTPLHPASAAVVTWTFEAQVRNADGDADLIQALTDLGFVAGTSIVGSLSFDTTAPDTNPNDDGGFYQNALLSFAASASGVAIVGDGSFNRVATTNAAVDRLDASDGVEIAGLAGRDASFVLTLADSTGSFLASDRIPLGSYGLDDFDAYSQTAGLLGTGFHLAVSDGGRFATLGSELTRLEVTTIPVPTSLWLFASGLLAVGARRRCAT